MQQNYQIWILESDGRVHVRVDALPDCVGDGPDEVGRDGVAEQVRAEDLGGAGKASPRWHHDVQRHVTHHWPVAVQQQTCGSKKSQELEKA